MRTLYVYLDDSGNLDFTLRGTKFFVLSAMTTTAPLRSSAPLVTLKRSWLEQGMDIEGFHATEDKQIVRDSVFAAIAGIDCIRYDFTVVEKRKTHPTLQTPRPFWRQVSTTLLGYVFRSDLVAGYDQVVVVMDKVLTHKDRSYIEAALKPALKTIGKPFQLYFHATHADFNGQLADYGAWSIFVKHERAELRPYTSIAGLIRSEFEIFRRGSRFYY